MHPIIVHLPHISTFIPPSVRSTILLTDDELRAEVDKITDHSVDKLFMSSNYNIFFLKFKYSRLVVDVERFRNDIDEPMFKYGQGAVYTMTSDSKLLRNISNDFREKLLTQFYDTHQNEFILKVDKCLEEHQKCLIVDVHSYSDAQVKGDPVACDVCIGTDLMHTRENVVDILKSAFKRYHLHVVENQPYDGAFVPLKYYKKDNRVQSVMIELNKSVYLNDDLSLKPRFYDLQNCMSDIFKDISLIL